MLPSLGSPSMNHLPSIAGAGLLVFVPWYLLRDKRIDLDEIVDQRRMLGSASQLDEWLEKAPKDWGYRRYALDVSALCLHRMLPEAALSREDSRGN